MIIWTEHKNKIYLGVNISCQRSLKDQDVGTGNGKKKKNIKERGDE